MGYASYRVCTRVESGRASTRGRLQSPGLPTCSSLNFIRLPGLGKERHRGAESTTAWDNLEKVSIPSMGRALSGAKL